MINHTCPSTCPYWDKHYSKIENENANTILKLAVGSNPALFNI